MEKETFEFPEIELIVFMNKDVITTSSGGLDEDELPIIPASLEI